MKTNDGKFIFKIRGAGGMLWARPYKGWNSGNLVIQTLTQDVGEEIKDDNSFSQQWGIIATADEALEFASHLIKIALLVKEESDE